MLEKVFYFKNSSNSLTASFVGKSTNIWTFIGQPSWIFTQEIIASIIVGDMKCLCFDVEIVQRLRMVKNCHGSLGSQLKIYWQSYLSLILRYIYIYIPLTNLLDTTQCPLSFYRIFSLFTVFFVVHSYHCLKYSFSLHLCKICDMWTNY